MNIVESLVYAATQPVSPMHTGEVFAIWSLYVATTEARVFCQLLANHTNDKDLKHVIEHFVNDIEEPMIKKLKEFLAHECIPIPPVTGDKPRADEQQIPPGAKLTDAEIANLLVVKIEGLLNFTHFGLAQSIREDVGVTLHSIYNHLVAQGFTLKKTMRKRGWLRVPPLYPFSEGAQSS